MASYSGLTVVTGNVIPASWGNDVRDSVVNVFASAAARDSAVTVPVEGMLTYLQDAPKRYTYYNGTKWMIREARVRATTTQWVSNTTLSAVTGMTIPLDANSVYEWDLLATVFGTQNVGVLLALQIPAAATLDAQIQGWRDDTGGLFTSNVNGATGNAALGTNGWGYNATGPVNRSAVVGRGTITTGATAGNAVLLGAQRVSSGANASIVDGGTWMEVRQVA